MTKVYFYSYDTIYITYSSEEYDRTNDNESYLIYRNAKDFKGHFLSQLYDIYNELNNYKKTEMIINQNINY